MALELRFTIPGQAEREIPIDQTPLRIGALLSNQVVLRAPGVEPIHALIEENDQGGLVVTDLGSQAGIKVNGASIEVEAQISVGDDIQIGSVNLRVLEAVPQIPALPQVRETEVIGQILASSQGGSAVKTGSDARKFATPSPSPDTKQGAAVPVQATEHRPPLDKEARKKDILFSPRKARPAGDVLECVAYWGETVLEVELFHPSFKGFEQVTIGDPTKAHLIAAGKSHFEKMTFARVSNDGFKVYTRNGMHGRLRRGGKVERINDQGEYSLSRRDIAHIRYGAVSYFLMFVRPPALDFPRSGPRDPFFIGLVSLVMLIYFILVPIAWMHKPSPLKSEKDDIYQIVDLPTAEKKPEPQKKEKPPEPKKIAKIEEKKVPPKVPPKPVVKEQPKPAKPIEKEKPKQPKPVEKPVEAKKPTEVLVEKTPQKPQESAKPAGPVDKPTNKAPGALSNLNANLNGMPSTGAKNPDNKLAGPTLPNVALGKSGGPEGSGMSQKGGAIKGTNNHSVQGVEGVNNNKASGVNLSKLGLGPGKISSLTGPGAISTPFKDSAGGAGGGSGSASKTYGMGGAGSGSSLGLAGSGGKVGNFGSGSGGILGGQGGSGGAGGLGLGGGAGGGGGGPGGGGHGRANVSVPAGDPVVSGGLTSQEIMAVIRANLNQIRHCYETLLQRSPNAAGKMTVNFTIGTNGRVTDVSVGASTIADSTMRGCVTGAVRRWPFPQPRGGQPVTVNYPFVFNPL